MMHDHDIIPMLHAPAKINLGLEVLRRRPDGFHDINTVFAVVDISDRITLRRRDDSLITCSVLNAPDLKPDANNLCVRAAEALRRNLNAPLPGLHIELDKRIPMGAGLGGGSSDAATVLRGTVRLWNPALSEGELHEIAAELGSDVPFFLNGGIAVGSSRGEVLQPLDLHIPFTLLLVNPGIHVDTPAAYRAVNRTDERPPSDLPDILRRGIADPTVLHRELVNDFEPPVFAAHPRIELLKQRIYDAGALFALMSGSGSTLFGLFTDRMVAEQAAASFTDEWARVTSFAGNPDMR